MFRAMHTIICALLSAPSTQAKYKARHCLDNSSYLNFLKLPGLGFSKVYEQSSPGVLEGVLSIFLKRIFLLQNNGKNLHKTEGLAGESS